MSLITFDQEFFGIFRVHMLEEHIREIELQSQEKLAEEQKRNKDLIQRLEREKQLEIENYAIRLQGAERESATTTRDLTALRSAVDRLKAEKSQLEQELFEAQQSCSLLQQECTRLQDNSKRVQDQADLERSDNARLVEELNKEVSLRVLFTNANLLMIFLFRLKNCEPESGVRRRRR